MQHYRTPSGNFYFDAPEWQVDSGSSPVLPSRHRDLSRIMTSSFQPVYYQMPEVSTAKAELIAFEEARPIRAFMPRKDTNKTYSEEKFKFGNQQIMRKGGDSMAKSR